MAPDKTLLIIDDEENMRHMLQAMVSRHGYTVETADDGQDALRKIVAGQHFDFILCDIRMPQMDGLTFLKEANHHLQNSTVIMMSAYGSIDMALEAIKAGAYDFISKPFKTDEVLLTLKKAEEREFLKHENSLLKEQIKAIKAGEGFDKMVAGSKSMHALFALAGKVAPYDTTALIIGESGTGKELVARDIYAVSQRKTQPFLAVNCGSIPQNLLESELFGYVKGAFTGADKTRKGLFAEADGGTLFLDEIGELPLDMQVKLLRVLQEGEIKPVGANKTEKVNVLTLHIPPLRERPEDIPLLCRHFLKKLNKSLGTTISSITQEAMHTLVTHTWPGNVRELENVIQRGIVLAEGQSVGKEQLPPYLAQATPTDYRERSFTGLFLKDAQKFLEERLITRALEETGGNRLQASKLLEISYPSPAQQDQGLQDYCRLI